MSEAVRIRTPRGEVVLRQPGRRQVERLKAALPLGLLRFREPVKEARFGIVMKCGDSEAWAVKQQPPDFAPGVLRSVLVANAVLVAMSLAAYRGHGFGGCLLPCDYVRKKGEAIEPGICCFGCPCPTGIEAAEFPFFGGIDQRFGHGFGTMLTHFIRALKTASADSGITLQPCIGLEHRPRSLLGSLAFGFLVHGREIYCLKTRISVKDPVWTVLSASGISELWFLPSVPVEIPEGQGPLAKPTPGPDRA